MLKKIMILLNILLPFEICNAQADPCAPYSYWYEDKDNDGLASENAKVISISSCDPRHDTGGPGLAGGNFVNGQPIYDCDDSDPNRREWVEVYEDKDGDGFRPQNSDVKKLCFYGKTKDINPPPSKGIFPEDEGYTAKYLINNLTIGRFDCDDNEESFSNVSRAFYPDADGDGSGTGTKIGETCEVKHAFSDYDCNDNDSNLVETRRLGFPDKIMCDRSIYRLAVDLGEIDPTTKRKEFSDFKINVYGDELRKDLAPEDQKFVKKFTLVGLVNGLPASSPGVYCLENCPSWTLSYTTGNVEWRDISFDGMKPVTPYENGVFDPNKPAKFRVKFRIQSSIYPGGFTSTEYLIIDYIPECPDLTDAEKLKQIFDRAFILKNFEPNNIVGMDLRFRPVCPSNNLPIKLTALAKALDVDHFNWWQSFQEGLDTFTTTELNVTELMNSLRDEKYTLPVFPVSDFVKFKNFEEWHIDPPLGKSSVISLVQSPTDKLIRFSIVNNEADMLPFYINESDEIKLFTRTNELRFIDRPYNPFGWYSGYGAPPLRFMTRVAGVKNGVFKFWTSSTYQWISTAMSKELRAPVLSFRKNLEALNPDLIEGSNDLIEISRNDMPWVPKLIGDIIGSQDVSDKIEKNKFKIEIVDKVLTKDVPEGQIIAQDPLSFTELSVGGKIKVVVAVSEFKNCGSILHGTSITKTAFKKLNASQGETCNNLADTKVISCSDGILSDSNSLLFESCKEYESQPASCIKTKVIKCSAKILESSSCEIPKETNFVKKDESFDGSYCHESPKNISIWNVLKLINSYSFTDNKLKVYYGCNAKFEIRYKDICSK